MLKFIFTVGSKLTFFATLLGIVIFSASAISVLYFYNGTEPYPEGCGVVFGAAVKKDDIPSNALAVRIDAAAKLYKEGATDCLILSGGPSTYGAHEADVMKKELLAAGIPEDAMTLDREARNTLATLLKLDPDEKYIFISNNFHLARIHLLANRIGLNNYSLTGADQLGGGYYVDGKLFLHEVVGGVYYFFRLDEFLLN